MPSTKIKNFVILRAFAKDLFSKRIDFFLSLSLSKPPLRLRRSQSGAMKRHIELAKHPFSERSPYLRSIQIAFIPCEHITPRVIQSEAKDLFRAKRFKEASPE